MAGDTRNRRHSGKAEKAADILRSLLAGKKWQRRIELHQVFLFWQEAVGEGIAAHAEPEVIRGTVLWIKVSDSVWMQQLHLQKMLLLEELNARLAGDKLTDLRFHLDVDAGTPPKKPAKKGRRRVRTSAPPPELERMIGLMESQEMQEAMRRLWRKAHEKESSE